MRQIQYGEKRREKRSQFLEKVFVIDINITSIIEKYGEIDAFSQGKSVNAVPKMRARNMGKNDLWIAATANVYDMTLVTTDKDFSHLDDEYLDFLYVDLQKYR